MNILAVDDEELPLRLLVDSISKAIPSAEIHSFQDPNEALEHLSTNQCDIAFLDIEMRGMTGLEFSRKLKDISPQTNIIFVTGHTEYAVDAFRVGASDYLLKPPTPESVLQALEQLRNPIRNDSTNRIRIQCFGNFEVFYNGKPLAFKRIKTRELFAYLVDRAGAGVTSEELISVLWENGLNTHSRQSNLRNLISDMKKTLAETDADDVIIKNGRTIVIDCNAVECDYFDFLHNIPYAINCYHGEYMAQYSWAEITTAAFIKINGEFKRSPFIFITSKKILLSINYSSYASI